MKKLLLLITSVMFVFGLNAQSLKNTVQSTMLPQQSKEENSKEAVNPSFPSYFNSPMMANPPALKMKQKSGYTPLVNPFLSTQYAAHSASHQWGDKWATTFLLRPDTLAKKHTLYLDAPGTGTSTYGLHALGYVFDPYSKAFDPDTRVRFMTDAEGNFTNYRIDSIAVAAYYRTAPDYDPVLYPDTLMVYVSYYNVYYNQSLPNDRRVNAFTLYFENIADAQVMPPAAKYISDNIPQQGDVVIPGTENTVAYPYVLTTKDTTHTKPGFVRPKYMYLPINLEVPAGCVASVIIKYLPGTPYSLGDTISVLRYNRDLATEDDLGQGATEIFYQNVFMPAVIADTAWENYLDYGDGYNTRIVESRVLRYKISEGNDHYFIDDRPDGWNPNRVPVYSHYYYPIPQTLMWISQGTDVTPDPINNVNEANAIVSKIYPNPANDQIRVELKSGGVAEITIFNLLGQTVKTETLNETLNTINVSSLNPGIYMLKVSQGGNVYTTKFTKK